MELIEAAKKGDSYKVKELIAPNRDNCFAIKAKCNVDLQDKDGYTANGASFICTGERRANSSLCTVLIFLYVHTL